MIAEPKPIAVISPPKRRFDLREMARLTMWGVSAAAALTLAAVASTTDAGEERMVRAIATIRGKNDVEVILAAERAATQRLADNVRTLATDRERLLARLSTVEQNVEDMTGSISRFQRSEPAPVVQPPLPVAAPVASLPAHVAPAVPLAAAPTPKVSLPMILPTGPLSEPVSTASVWSRVAVPLPRPSPMIAQTHPDATAIAARDDAADAPPAGKTEFGIDLGGAANVEGLRAMWTAMQAKHGAALASLRPVISIQENRPGAVELRLVAGPIPNAAAAARLCAVLIGAICHPTVFEGQRLALR